MKAPKVEVLNGFDYRDKHLTITKGAAGYGLQCPVADGSGSVMIATCTDPGKLGRWALDGGAREVFHDYDLTSKGEAERRATP